MDLYGKQMSQEEIINEVNMLWDNIDNDGNGEIDYTEWALSTINKEALLTEKRLK